MGEDRFQRAGDFSDFVTTRYADLLRTAYLLTGTTHAAEDLLQASLLRTLRRWQRVEDPHAYVRRCMVNERTSWWRRLRGAEVLAASPPDRGRPDHADDIATRDELLTALAGLPARMRAVLVLRYWEDLSEADTAAALNCSIGSVKSQASRGLARMRQVLAVHVPGGLG
jgi:RNA polymerase sigma-70 factor (sigma-E family)